MKLSSKLNPFLNSLGRIPTHAIPLLNGVLSKGPNVSDVTVNGKPVKAVAGQKVSQVMAASRVKMTYR